MYLSLGFFFFSPLQSLLEFHSCDLSLVLNLKLHFQAMQVARAQLGHGSPNADSVWETIPHQIRPTRLPGSELKSPELTPRERALPKAKGGFSAAPRVRKRGSPQQPRTISQPPAHPRPQPLLPPPCPARPAAASRLCGAARRRWRCPEQAGRSGAAVARRFLTEHLAFDASSHVLRTLAAHAAASDGEHLPWGNLPLTRRSLSPGAGPRSPRRPRPCPAQPPAPPGSRSSPPQRGDGDGDGRRCGGRRRSRRSPVAPAAAP